MMLHFLFLFILFDPQTLALLAGHLDSTCSVTVRRHCGFPTEITLWDQSSVGSEVKIEVTESEGCSWFEVQPHLSFCRLAEFRHYAVLLSLDLTCIEFKLL